MVYVIDHIFGVGAKIWQKIFYIKRRHLRQKLNCITKRCWKTEKTDIVIYPARVIILKGNSEYFGAHEGKNRTFWGKKIWFMAVLDLIECVKQIKKTDIAPYVRTYFWVSEMRQTNRKMDIEIKGKYAIYHNNIL